MTTASLPAVAAVPSEDQLATRLLRIHARLAAYDPASFGWDATEQVVVFSPDHPTFGYKTCPVRDCGQEASAADGLCTGCRLQQPGTGLTLEGFIARGRQRKRSMTGDVLCLVCRTPGHVRPAKENGLCISCGGLARQRGQTAQEHVAGSHGHPPAVPRTTYGQCAVRSCTRWACGSRGACETHLSRWRRQSEPDWETFLATAGPAYGDRGGNLILRGLPPLVQAEILAGLVSLDEAHSKDVPSRLRGITEAARSRQVRTLAELDAPEVGRHILRFVRRVDPWVALDEATPAQQRHLDTWDLRAFGMSGTLSFAGRPARHGKAAVAPIQQGWLRDTAKTWAYSALGRNRTSTGVAALLATLGLWSAELAKRPDCGEDPGALGRGDVQTFLAQLAAHERSGSMTARRRRQHVADLRRFLLEVRDAGYADPGQDAGPAAGLPQSVSVPRTEVPERQKVDVDDEAGDAIPAGVLRQLCTPAALQQLAGQRPGRAAVRRFLVGLNTGRRPDELCSVPLDCLAWDDAQTEDGELVRLPVLVHDMSKVNVIGYRLEIDGYTAELIQEQQKSVREQFPGTPPSELALWPRAHRNPRGTESIGADQFARQMREWVLKLPALWEAEPRGDDGWDPVLGPDGEPVAFERAKVFPYALRHTYAQRHADNGTPPEVLQRLMGHEKIDTTMGYFRVSRRRRRAAVERLAPLQVNADGRRMLSLTPMTESQAARYEVGQVAVPFGVCVEPSNVQAQGRGCPFRHVCTGCAHFRTDPSYLPELRAYLAQLLEARERLEAANPEVSDWARVTAMPSHDEIESVRRLIASCEAAVGDLPEPLRAELEEAVRVARTARAAMDATFPTHLRSLVAAPTPTVFPRASDIA